MLELLVFGTFWFWLILAAHAVLLITFMECNKNIFSGILTAATIAAVIGLGNMGALSWIYQNPGMLCAAIGGYFVVAVIWTFIKWIFYTHEINEFAKYKKLDWIKVVLPNMITGATWTGSDYKKPTAEELQDYKASVDALILVGAAEKAWNKYVEDWEKERQNRIRGGLWRINKPLRCPHTMEEVGAFVEDNKGRIVSWMTYWPWSMVWTLLNDPIRKLMQHIFYAMRGMLKKIAAKTFGVEG